MYTIHNVFYIPTQEIDSLYNIFVGTPFELERLVCKGIFVMNNITLQQMD